MNENNQIGRLPKGQRTPEGNYYQPILHALEDLGGSARMNDVLAKMEGLMKEILKAVDYDFLSSGQVRWRNTAQFARNRMIERGLLKADSARGIWEITEAGRKFLRNETAEAIASKSQVSLAFTIEIFCCYARKDQELLESLKTHLMPLQRQGLITLWSDTDINAGADWEAEIEQHLDMAQIILLLVSPDFMASDYSFSKEMTRAMERHEQGEAKVIPVILRPTLWHIALFGKLQALPKDARPVTDLKSWHTQDEAFYDVATSINTVVKELRLGRYRAGAEQLYHEGRHGEALMFYDQAIALEPGFTPALLGKGKTLLALKRYEESLMTFDQALQADARVGNAAFYLNKARALRGLARYEESLVAYDQAIQISSHVNEINSSYGEKAEIFYLLQRYEEALECYKKLSRRQPGEAKYYEQIVDTLLELQRPEEALEMIQKAINVRPKEDQYYYKKGKILDDLKRYEEAIVAYEQAIDLCPIDHFYSRYKGIALLALKKYEEALEVFVSIITSGKDGLNYLDDPDDYHGKGQALMGLEKYEEALEAFEEAIHLSDNEVDPQIYHNKGVAYEKLAKQSFETEKWARVSWNREAVSINTDMLVEGYEAVRKGYITNPTIINKIAKCFEVLANDPEVNKSFIYDATRAAQTLYQRAKQYAEIQDSKTDTASTLMQLSTPELSISDDPFVMEG